MDIHEKYMHRCLQLAESGLGNVAPNPMVGSVLVYEDNIIGEGFHAQFGQAHAEVNCLANVPDEMKYKIEHSTLYVSLEPCTHFGKTPPCSDLIIRHNIKKVVIACTDSYEKVNGSGIATLKAAGIEVIQGVLEKEAQKINKRFFTFHREQRPYIILKWAQSNDKKLAADNGIRTYISNAYSNFLVHKWRSEEAAIMVGTNTAINDEPSLTTRLWQGKNPLRIVIDKNLKIPLDSLLLSDANPTIIINNVKQEEVGNKVYYKTGADENLIAVTLNLLHQRNITSLLVEGGSILLQSFIDAGLWDEARIITNRSLHIGAGIDAPVIKLGETIQQLELSGDLIQVYKNL